MENAGSQEVSFREHKKEKLRRNLISTARRLFRDNGYDETTLESIVAPHDVHVRTLLRYFGTKEDLALAHEREMFVAFRTAAADVKTQAQLIDLWRAQVRSPWREPDETRLESIHYFTMLYAVPVLRAAIFDLDRQYEQVLAYHLARIARMKYSEDAYAQLLAANLVCAPRNVVQQILLASALKRKNAEAITEGFAEAIDIMVKHFPSRRVLTPACAKLRRLR